tara:strand:+ start:1124 stop:1342 length:219 start_codon:yes stop_codon:yes gene_type:complete
MGKKKILSESLETCLGKARDLIDFLPKTGLKYLEKAKKDYEKLYKNENGNIEVLMRLQSLSYAYSNPGEPVA